MNLQRFQTKNEAFKAAQRELVIALQKQKEQPTLFLSSGGSAFDLLDIEIKQIFGPHFTMGVLDERFSHDPNVNNFIQAQNTKFCQLAVGEGCELFETWIADGEILEHFADRFEDALHTWKGSHPDGRVVITQGIGEDGHTAGIMPFPEDEKRFRELFEGERWVVGYDAGKKNQYPERVTVTLPFLREIVDESIVYVVGEAKRKAFERVLTEKGSLAETPARIIREMKYVSIFTDIAK